MSQYKVGDLASLFPVPSEKGSGRKLQALFNQQNQKNKQFKKRGKNQVIQDKPEFEMSKKASGKRKRENSEIADENESLDKKPVSQKIVDDSGFKRSSKKQRKFHQEKHSVSYNEATPQEENLFVVDNTPDTEINDETQSSKKQKKKKIKYNKQFSVENLNGGNIDDVETNSQATNFGAKKVKQNKKISAKNLDDNGTENVDEVDSNVEKKTSPKKGKKRFSNQNAQDDSEEGTEKKVTKFQKKPFNLEKMKADKNKDLATTLFVGNLPLSATKKMLQEKFHRFGPLKTVRLRGAIPAKENMPRKVAEIRNKYHECMKSLKGYVVFKDRESAESALSLNGAVIDNHHILVDFATQPGEKKLYDNNLSVFIGNLPFNITDDSVWSAFEPFGEISAVRIIRDRANGIGKGFGYVQFKNVDAKKQALSMQDLEIEGRQIRIKPVNNSPQKKTAKESFQMIRSSVAMKKRSEEYSNKKSVKKLLKKGRRMHQNKQIAQKLGKKWKNKC